MPRRNPNRGRSQRHHCLDLISGVSGVVIDNRGSRRQLEPSSTQPKQSDTYLHKNNGIFEDHSETCTTVKGRSGVNYVGTRSEANKRHHFRMNDARCSITGKGHGKTTMLDLKNSEGTLRVENSTIDVSGRGRNAFMRVSQGSQLRRVVMRGTVFNIS